MTVPSTASEISYAGDGISVAFPIPFPFDTSADIFIKATDANGSISDVTSSFTVTGGGGGLGTATAGTAPASGLTITIYDDPEQSQETDYVDNDAFPAAAHEGALDKLTRLVKRLRQRVNRSLRTADGDPIIDLTLGTVDNRKGKFLFFNAVTGAIEYALSLGTTVISRSILGAMLNPQTVAESNALVVPVDYAYDAEIANFRRYRSASVIEGTTNESTQLSGASAAAAGKILLLPKGTYLVTNTWTLSAGLTILGEGPGTIIKMQSSQLAATDLAGITFKNLKIINNGISGAGLIFTRCNDLTFEGVEFDNTLGATNPSGTTAIWLKGCDNVNIGGAKFINCHQAVYCDADGAGAESGTVSIERFHCEHTILSASSFPAQFYQFRGKHLKVSLGTFKNIFPGGADPSPRGYCIFEGDGVGESITTSVRDVTVINTATVGETGPNVFVQVAQSRKVSIESCYYDSGGQPGEFFEGGGLDRTTLFDNDIINSYVLLQPLDGATLCGSVDLLNNRFRLSSQGLAAVRVGANGNGFNYLNASGNEVNGSSGGGLFVSDVRKYARVVNNIFLDCNLADTAFSAGVNEFSVAAISFFGSNARLGIVSGNHCENTLGGTGHTDFGFACDATTHAIDVRPDNIFLRMDNAPHRNTLKQATNAWAVYQPGYIFFVGDPLTGQLPGRMVTHYFRTTISVTEAAGQTVLSVTDNTGMANGDVVSIQLDNSTSIATYHHAVINATGAGTITISGGGLPSQAAAGKEVFVNRLKALANLA